jgi:putative DNA primase/helicase
MDEENFNLGAELEKIENPKLKDIIMDISDIPKLNLRVREEYLCPWLKESSISLISGWRGVGKTFFLMGAYDAITKGGKFGQWECLASVPCLLVDGEMPIEDIKDRSEALGITSDRENPFYIYSDALANRAGFARADLTNPNWRHDVKSFILDHGIKVVGFDNLASLASGLDENVKKEWDPINQWLLELRFAGVATQLLHHLGKSGNQRGTSAREDNLDMAITLKQPHDYTPEDGARYIVHFSKARIPVSDLNLITDTEFKLIQDEHGNHIWTFNSVKKETKNEVLRLLDEGLSQTDIKNTLNIHKGTVSKIRKKAIDEGFLTKKNQLTQPGIMAVNG